MYVICMYSRLEFLSSQFCRRWNKKTADVIITYTLQYWLCEITHVCPGTFYTRPRISDLTKIHSCRPGNTSLLKMSEMARRQHDKIGEREVWEDL